MKKKPIARYSPTGTDIIRVGSRALLYVVTNHPNGHYTRAVITSPVTKKLKNGIFYTQNTKYIPNDSSS